MNSGNEAKGRQTMEFQAEVKQLLDIVINSLYTDREIFLRELISNSADALEKYRYESLVNKDVADPDLPLEIKIEADEKEGALTITDTGIGMTRDELVGNLGTIAYSGSRSFFQQLGESDRKDLNLIGQFGVGFYAAFMVAKKVRVLSKSYRPGAEGCVWQSDGLGGYTVEDAPGLRRGTQIILELKDDAKEFANTTVLKRIIKQYSNFVPFPILVEGEKVNTVQAIWTRSKNEIKDEEYNEFYRFVGNAFDEPLYQLHFTAEAPLSINALLFVPGDNFERFGMGRLEPGVHLYCRKVLIQQNAEGLLPDWLRFLKGVVDSEDIPLNISRQTMQDSALVSKLRRVITGRFLKFLDEQARADKEKYAQFWKAFSGFLKEGAAADPGHRNDLAKLLRFESSASEAGELVSLEEYAGRMKEGQKYIFYINGPDRGIIESGPYLEAFRARDIEVLYTHEPIDDFVVTHLTEYKDKKLVSADQANLELPGAGDDQEQGRDRLDAGAAASLAAWLKETLGDKVGEVRESVRLVDSPAILINLEEAMTSSMQRVMQMVNRDFSFTGRKALEINPRHPLIKGLAALREKDGDFARAAAEQLFDNALIASGMIVDPRGMVDRLYKILERAVK
jgi:molecular chaperone HtpG